MPILSIVALLAGLSVFAVVFLLLSRPEKLSRTFEQRFHAICSDRGRAGEQLSPASKTKTSKPARTPVFDSAARLMTGDPYLTNLATWLVQADIPLRAHEFLVLRVALGLGAFAVGQLLIGPVWISTAVAVAVLQAPVLYGAARRKCRLERFNKQLAGALDMVASSLRSGQGFMQAMESATADLPKPIGTEFRRLLHETSLGIPMETALASLLRRVPTYELEITVAGWMIQREAGGNLSAILEKISQTIRDRLRLRGEVKALTAQGRISGIVAAVMPILMALAMLAVSPDYIMPLFTRPMGQHMIIFAGVMQVIGSLAIWKIVSVDI